MNRNRASLSGALIRECIRAAMRTKRLRDGGMIDLGAKRYLEPSKWRAPKGYTVGKYREGGLPLELLEREGGRTDAAILQFHGGAYLIGFSDMYRAFALRYSRLSGGMPVLSADYRIAPAYRHPAALEDALTAWAWLLRRGFSPADIIVAGDSAGGNLALALALKLRDEGRALPGALILMSPWADMTGTGESRAANLDLDPMFGRSAGDRALPGNPYAGDADLRHPYLSPVFADYSGFPPMLIQVGTWEVLLSDSRTVAEKARNAGTDVTLSEYPGMFHVFQSLRHCLPESRKAWKEAGQFIQRIKTPPPPPERVHD